MKKNSMIFIVLFFLCFAVAPAQEKKEVPKLPGPFDLLTPEFGYADDPTLTFQEYLWNAVVEAEKKWIERYEAVKTPEQAIQYQQEQRHAFQAAVGPFPEKTPLNARTTKTHQKEGYRVEMVLLETRPKFYMTGALFLPDDPKWKAPYPGIVVLCGHSDQGKGRDLYNRTCALAALNGVAAIIVDPIGQGERMQPLKKDGTPYMKAPVASHNLFDVGSIAVGRGAAHFMIWDAIRAVDYLESRSDIDAKRIGAAGNSGGGTQTSYLMALDPRIAVAAPSCYTCTMYGRILAGGKATQDAEWCIFSVLSSGLDYADYSILHAPRPTLLCTATRDHIPIEYTWQTFRLAKRFYDRFNAAEKVSLIETDEPHGWTKNLREATIRWMVRWFYDRNVDITEPESLQELSKDEIFCLEEKQVLKLEGAKSTFDLNWDLEKTLKQQRQERWKNGLTDDLRNEIRQLIVARPLSEIPQPAVETKGAETKVSPFGVECRLERFVMKPEPGIVLPIIRLTPTQIATTAKPILVLNGNGKSAALTEKEGGVERFLKEGRTVVLADLRGFGETQHLGQPYFNPKHHGRDADLFYMAYLFGRSCVGMRTEDLCNVARWMKADQAGQGIDLYAYGLPGTVALHAAALEPSLFGVVDIEASLASWSNVVEAGVCFHPNIDLVRGALAVYDIPNLVESLGSQLSFRNPINAHGKPFGTPFELP